MSKIFLENIKRALYVFWLNPIFFFKRVFFELQDRILPLPKPGIFKTNGVSFDFDFGFSHKIRKMYFGTFQSIISEMIKKYLKKGDTFIDVGANIGYFSFVAAGVVGEAGQVYSFEPIHDYFVKLDNFARINKQYTIKANMVALGDEKKTAKIFIKGGTDIGNNTFFSDLLGEGNVEKTADVEIIRLDNYIKDNNLKKIKLIKIDVEGFEFQVLKGLEGYFRDCSETKNFPFIICEIVPEAYKGKSEGIEDLFEYMANFSYYPFNILNNKKSVDIEKIKNGKLTDIIFIHIK